MPVSIATPDGQTVEIGMLGGPQSIDLQMVLNGQAAAVPLGAGSMDIVGGLRTLIVVLTDLDGVALTDDENTPYAIYLGELV